MMAGDRCGLPIMDAQNHARICGAPATTTRTVRGVKFTTCGTCAAAVDAQGPDDYTARRISPPLPPWPDAPAPPAPAPIDDTKARARFEARQAKLPPHKRRTWEQAGAADDEDLARALRKAGKDGGL
jgi:hypothetical protein